MKIDGQEYAQTGTVKFSQGSGESQEEFEMTVLGSDRWLLKDGADYWLYGSGPDWALQHIARVEEEFQSDKVTGDFCGQGRMRWVTLNRRFSDLEPPFAESDHALLVASGEVLAGVALWPASSTEFYSARFPAARLPAGSIAPTPLGAGTLKAPQITCIVLAVLFGLAAAAPWTWAVRLLWWLGPIAAVMQLGLVGHSAAGGTLRVVGAGFFWYFVTHFLDTIYASGATTVALARFEAAHAAIIFLALLGLRQLHFKYFYAATQGGQGGGGCAWFLMVCGLGTWCMIDEDLSWLSWFGYYSSTLPWWPLWLLLAGGYTVYKYKDFKKVPMTVRAFSALAGRCAEILTQDLKLVSDKAEALALWADDLHQALEYSCDPLVLSLQPLEAGLAIWVTAAGNLKKLDPAELSEKDRELLAQDLALLAADLKAIGERAGQLKTNPQLEFPQLRVSPFLLTLGK